jgi:IS5 family transposase
LKTDNYAVKTNVHFPTDLNLLWDSLRKCLDTVEKLQALTPVKGWRKIKYIRKTLKSQFRRTSHQVFKGKSAQLKKQSVQQYLYQARLPEASVAVLIKHPPYH